MNSVKYICICFLISFATYKSTGKANKGNINVYKAELVYQSKQVEPTVGLNLGNKAPEISFKNAAEDIIKLSSLKGQIVLIDFWASWCGPCRIENPAVVAAYNKYKNQKFNGGNGFTVYSVSLDTDKNKWRDAIEKDGLIWPNHVSDLKSWGSEIVETYDIKGIPTNVLINENGIIINKNLRGKALIKALDKLVIKK